MTDIPEQTCHLLIVVISKFFIVQSEERLCLILTSNFVSEDQLFSQILIMVGFFLASTNHSHDHCGKFGPKNLFDLDM